MATRKKASSNPKQANSPAEMTYSARWRKARTPAVKSRVFNELLRDYVQQQESLDHRRDLIDEQAKRISALEELEAALRAEPALSAPVNLRLAASVETPARIEHPHRSDMSVSIPCDRTPVRADEFGVYSVASTVPGEVPKLHPWVRAKQELTEAALLAGQAPRRGRGLSGLLREPSKISNREDAFSYTIGADYGVTDSTTSIVKAKSGVIFGAVKLPAGATYLSADEDGVRWQTVDGAPMWSTWGKP